MVRGSSHPFDLLVDRFAQLFAERVAAAPPPCDPHSRSPPTRSGNSQRTGHSFSVIDCPRSRKDSVVNRAACMLTFA